VSKNVAINSGDFSFNYVNHEIYFLPEQEGGSRYHDRPSPPLPIVRPEGKTEPLLQV
jgi:hypothetical protein